MISAFLLDRWIAARPPPDYTLKTLAAVAKALEAESDVRRNARSFAELGTEDVAKVTPPVESPIGRAHVFGEATRSLPSSARRPPRRSRVRSSRGLVAGSRRPWTRGGSTARGSHPGRRPDA